MLVVEYIMVVELNVKDRVASYLDRTKLPSEVEPLKDIVVTLSQALLELGKGLDVLKAENAALRAENAILVAGNAELKARNEILNEEVNLLMQKVFGRKKLILKKNGTK